VVFPVNVPLSTLTPSSATITGDIVSTASTDPNNGNDHGSVTSFVRAGQAHLTINIDGTTPSGATGQEIFDGNFFCIYTEVINTGEVRTSSAIAGPVLLTPTPTGVIGGQVTVEELVPGITPPTWKATAVASCPITGSITCSFSAIEARTTYRIKYCGVVRVSQTTTQTLTASLTDPTSNKLKQAQYAYQFIQPVSGTLDPNAAAVKAKNKGAMIGGIIAGILLIICVAVALWAAGFFKRKRPEEIAAQNEGVEVESTFKD